ncbi:hypothetical protein F5B22DRAFT_625035 [Xylaria bambusicola]|uniref:uncharacterized protein n=1 Tax=Xylaria bambusicola TaxID=326684 RepID=UPI0020073741|nr:uncharacterized protein F5B22DRAFT_625035 [Xylaria bambusicola]KAI0506181.1 hypothetical protein F5B22DRAFT_625035 [Xylaria bambusicola]
MHLYEWARTPVNVSTKVYAPLQNSNPAKKGSAAIMFDEVKGTQREEESEQKFVEPISYPLFYEAAKLRIINPVPSKDESMLEGGKRCECPRSFHRFMALPMELRLKIWKLALPGPRILHISFSAEEGHIPKLHNGEPFDMPLARTCKESRAFLKDYGYKPLWPHLINPRNGESFNGPWILQGRDVVRNVWINPDLLFRLCPPG